MNNAGSPAAKMLAILRHSDISTTLQYYTQVPDVASREALQKIDDWFMGLDDSRDIMISDPDFEGS